MHLRAGREKGQENSLGRRRLREAVYSGRARTARLQAGFVLAGTQGKKRTCTGRTPHMHGARTSLAAAPKAASRAASAARVHACTARLTADSGITWGPPLWHAASAPPALPTRQRALLRANGFGFRTMRSAACTTLDSEPRAPPPPAYTTLDSEPRAPPRLHAQRGCFGFRTEALPAARRMVASDSEPRHALLRLTHFGFRTTRTTVVLPRHHTPTTTASFGF